jgi:hypothetical protein
MMRGSKVLSWVVLGSLALGVVLMLGLVTYRQGVSAEESAQQHAEIVALQAGLDEANARLEAEGAAPVPVPSVEPGADAPVVPIAPTQDQILSAFDVWCDLRSCDGSDGADGEDAPAMTREQIFAGFSQWCSTDPRCVGTDGADSTVPGPAGRPPTEAEVLAAVNTVCSTTDLCRGPAGKDGTDGEDGRGIAKVECHTTGDWIFTWTDGTASTVTGPCRVMQPEPSPTATTTKK